jgi:hypothetical protein
MVSPTAAAPIVPAASPQACLDRLKHALLNLSEVTADVERLEASPSNNLTSGETAAIGFLREEVLTSIKERLNDLHEASPSLVRMARGESPSHREADRAFLCNITGKLDALEYVTRVLLGLAAFAATQSCERVAN